MKSLKKDATLRYQNATAMLLDLKRALKEPNGNFVDNNDYQSDFPTQRISTLGMEEDRNMKDTDKKRYKAYQFEEYLNILEKGTEIVKR